MRLAVDRLTRSFGPRRIFGPLSFEVLSGRVLGIAGANGAGKTTLVKTLAGLIRPSGGSVSLDGVDGHDGNPVSPREALHALGWVAPDLALYGDLTASENLAFFRRVAGGNADETFLAARLEGVGLDPVRLAAIHSRFLSTGQRQRLKLAFATVNEPQVLLLDEPSSNLDEPGRAVVMKVVAEQRLRGLAVIASNDPRDLALADEMVSL